MDMLSTLGISCKTTPTWKFNGSSGNNNGLPKSPSTKTLKTPPKVLSLSINPSSASLLLKRKSYNGKPNKKNSTKQTTPLLEKSHENQRIRTLPERFRKEDSNPLQTLKDDGDWTNHQFWAVIKFLKRTARSKEALQVFGLWKNTNESRINELNYEKIIRFLVEEGLMEDVVLAYEEMKNHGLKPSVEIYNSLIYGFARKGRFEDGLFYLKQMEEINLKPDTETYDGLIEAYGNHGMYDEMAKCVKKMESDGCIPDHITYNLLIREFSRAGLLKRMERVYHILISKRMDLQSSTLVSMLEAYANFGILDKMEKVYKRALTSKTLLKEDLIRKLARFYIENHMFSRLDDLGLDLSSKTGMTDFVWCLRLLSHACLLSRKGMDSILQEMELEKIPWNASIANIILLACLKMKDLKQLKVVLSELPARYVKPDIVTVGILYDAFRAGFEGKWVLMIWRKMGFLDEAVEMNTDVIVLSSFGKGHILRSWEERHSLEPKGRQKKIWTYHHVINLFFKHDKRPSQLVGVE
ncbi:pentatricopeptide repeat-containing protein At4g14190, chloroplastic-like [Cornus florida]|uniref:pentatricopeptide repeat-containing protein At4g14190, chloroplastic-like n=1 Tax=Cornus florida TaxID=4283 RepID=UPI00289F66DA|nr:pentatricopeptide repeat-containing protein At4g14190, chloroplastic-like [Cornus florida]